MIWQQGVEGLPGGHTVGRIRRRRRRRRIVEDEIKVDERGGCKSKDWDYSYSIMFFNILMIGIVIVLV